MLHSGNLEWCGNILLHRKGSSPGAIVLRLIFIWMIGIGLGVNVCLSVVEVGR